jgi:hypothetical protein
MSTSIRKKVRGGATDSIATTKTDDFSAHVVLLGYNMR